MVDLSLVQRGSFNMIVSSCGTGKTHFCANTLTDYYKDILPGEILFVTSRSLAANQLVRDCDISERFNIGDFLLRSAWSGIEHLSYIADKGIQVTTYDKIINLLIYDGADALTGVKLIVFDECHALFSDTFIDNVEFLKMWIRYTIERRDHIIFGLTATPNIIYHYSDKWGVEINTLCDPLYRYKAKNLWVVDFKALPEFCRDKLTDGKTIIMCDSIRITANVLLNSIPGSRLLVSKNNSANNKSYYVPADMDYIRSSIITKGVLPNNIDTLISTSTVREGFNLVEESGVKNIICCFPDEINITQLLGRCRYNVENLVVVNKEKLYSSTKSNTYLTYMDEQYEMFEQFLAGKSDGWFYQFRHIVEGGVDDVKRYTSEKSSLKKVKRKVECVKNGRPNMSSRKAKNEMKQYIDKNFLIKPGMTGDEVSSRCIDNDKKKQIVDKAAEIGLFGADTGKYSFIQISNWLSEDLGFDIDRSCRKVINGKRSRFTTFTEVKS